MATACPTMRLAGNRPPSTHGKTASITARTLPSPTAATVPAPAVSTVPVVPPRLVVSTVPALRLALAMAFPAQDNGRERRQREAQGFDAAMRTHRHGFNRAQVSPAGAPVILRIGVDEFAPEPARGYADQKILARHRRKVAHHQQPRAIVRR